MTVQSVMDKFYQNDTAFANGNEIEFVDLSESTSVATLDVTSEEINCNQRVWGSGINSDVAANLKVNCLDQRVKNRSKTWSSGLSDEESKRKIKVNQDITKLDIPNETSSREKRRLSNPTNFRKTFIMSSTGNSQNKQSNTIDKSRFMTSRKTLPELSALKMTSNVSNGDLDDHSLEIDEESNDLAGFMDINLGQSNPSLNEKVHIQHKHQQSLSNEKQSKKPYEYLFDWMSPRSVDIDGKQTMTDPEKKFTRDLSNDRSSDTTSSYISTSSNKIPAFKVIQKALLSNSQKQSSQVHSLFGPPSTTALILESRPRNLPSKSIDEAKKHLAEYDKMITILKKNELKDVEKKMKQLKQQQECEERIASNSSVWLNQILPSWSTACLTTRTRQLWWDGLPPNVRGKVWQLAIGNELNITKELYSIMVARAHDKLRHMNEAPSYEDDMEQVEADREDTVDLIRLDISRTFPHLCIFQKGGPYHQLLHDVLGAYACYRPDVGYVQGMSFMAAMLLLNMEPAKAFVTFSNLLNKPCQVAFFRLNEEMMKTYFAAFEVFFEENLPAVFAHFKVNNLTPDMYLIDWIFTMFSKALDLDTASRVWDVFCRDGEEFLFRTAIAILKLNGDLLLSMEFIQAAQYLIKLPSTFTHQQLFDVIATVTMVSRGNRHWKDVLSLMKDTT